MATTNQPTTQEMKEIENNFLQEMETMFPKNKYSQLYFYVSKNLLFYEGSLSLNQAKEIGSMLLERDEQRYKDFLTRHNLCY